MSVFTAWLPLRRLLTALVLSLALWIGMAWGLGADLSAAAKPLTPEADSYHVAGEDSSADRAAPDSFEDKGVARPDRDLTPSARAHYGVKTDERSSASPSNLTARQPRKSAPSALQGTTSAVREKLD